MSVVTRSALERSAIERMVREAVRQRLGRDGQRSAPAAAPRLVVNISARHMHITQENLEKLFGAGAKLTVQKMLYQEGQFASEQTVTIIGPRHRTITNLRILGPCRTLNQIELAFTDGIAMGIDLPVRMSGDVAGSPGCIVLGPKGYIELKEGVIRAKRHVHMSPADAAYYGVKPGEGMLLKVESGCPMTFDNVIARVDPAFKLEVHIDTDEGNACDLPNATRVELMKA